MIALFAIGYASFYFLFFGKGWVKTRFRNRFGGGKGTDNPPVSDEPADQMH